MFGNGLHTHLVGMYGEQFHFSIGFALHYGYSKCLQLCLGHGLVLQHFRQTDECGGLEELEPIDSNLKYDFNYQVAGLEIRNSYEPLVSIL